VDLPAPPPRPQQRDLVAIGASAGGVEALKTLVARLPADLPATVLVALHLPASARSFLADILARAGALPVRQARPDMPLVPGEVVVAHPDAHLLVVDDRIVLGSGPRENGARPSHDAMLRSVALARRGRVVAGVLTGLLDDGAAGLHVVARYGGHCLVQDPAEAEFPSMPTAALRAVPTARSLPLQALAEEVVRAVSEVPPAEPVVPEEQWQRDLAELQSALGRPPVLPDGSPAGEPSPYACPDCHGVLNTVPDPGVLRFRCRTGHAWSAESLVAQQDNDVEEALWTALRVLEERAEMSRRLADLALTNGREWSQEHFLSRAADADRSAVLLRAVLRRESDQPPIPSTATGT
jgi:two-component system, chemotaxis family, protein-glutamate methylesterase/glutaminase